MNNALRAVVWRSGFCLSSVKREFQASIVIPRSWATWTVIQPLSMILAVHRDFLAHDEPPPGKGFCFTVFICAPAC